MRIHLYLTCYPTEALIASHLGPDAFGHYMATGTRKLTRGSLVFLELDREKLDASAFRLDDLEERCVTHGDGSPKRSKYVSISRVLENLNLEAVRRLHLTTLDGRVLALEPGTWSDEGDETAFLYQELAPVLPLIASSLSPSRFCRFMTDPEAPLFLPRMFFADLLLDRDGSGALAGYLPYQDPLHIEECLAELQRRKGKPTKTVSRNPVINAFYRTVNRGFFLGDRTTLMFFPFPERRVLETEHAHWWRSAQMG